MNAKTNNIWGLKKDPAIKAIIILLQHEVGPGAFMLLDEDKLNDKAVRIVSPATQHELSAYIYCYAQCEERYGLDLEFPYLIETRADDQTLRLDDLSAEDVTEKVIDHLEIRHQTET